MIAAVELGRWLRRNEEASLWRRPVGELKLVFNLFILQTTRFKGSGGMVLVQHSADDHDSCSIASGIDLGLQIMSLNDARV
jgi:hypothetical protein